MKFILKIIINLLAIAILIILITISTTMIISLNQAGSALVSLKLGYTPIKIYDDQNNLIYTSKENYEYTALDDISPNIMHLLL